MSAEDELDFVEAHFKPFKGKLKSIEDAYMAVLYPKAVGKGTDFVRTEEFVKLVRSKFPGAKILFNDSNLIRKGWTKKATGHDNHLHIRFP